MEKKSFLFNFLPVYVSYSNSRKFRKQAYSASAIFYFSSLIRRLKFFELRKKRNYRDKFAEKVQKVGNTWIGGELIAVTAGRWCSEVMLADQ